MKHIKPFLIFEEVEYDMTLAQLAHRIDRGVDSLVIYAIAKNPNTSVEKLQLLVDKYPSPSHMVRSGILNNPNVPTEILVQLAKDRDADIRERAISMIQKREENELKSYGWGDEDIKLARELGL